MHNVKCLQDVCVYHCFEVDFTGTTGARVHGKAMDSRSLDLGWLLYSLYDDDDGLAGSLTRPFVLCVRVQC